MELKAGDLVVYKDYEYGGEVIPIKIIYIGEARNAPIDVIWYCKTPDVKIIIYENHNWDFAKDVRKWTSLEKALK